MNRTEIINKIKVMLGVDVIKHTFATKKLVDGTEISAEGEIGVGERLFVITPDGQVQAPTGKHTTDDGFEVVVDENGVITEINKVEELADENGEEKVEDEIVVNDEVIAAVVEALKPIMEEMKNIREEMGRYKEKMEKLSKEPAGEPVKAKAKSYETKLSAEDEVFNKRFSLLKDIIVK